MKAIVAVAAGAMLWTGWQTAEWRESQCYGSPSAGRLTGAKRLPLYGDNYTAYSTLMWAIGRSSMHKAVRDTLIDAYADLAVTNPELRFVYGESGWPRGGPFQPHRTHRNGLSVDLFVPVRDLAGNVTEPPTYPWFAFGYGLHYDADGKGHGQQIDFEALGTYIGAIQRAAVKRGVSVQRVIFQTELQKKLFATASGRAVSGKVPFMRTNAWVRHDEHFHVDFDVPCRKY